MADGLGGYSIEIRPTEACDQGQWKCVATSEQGAISISTCDIKMISMSFCKSLNLAKELTSFFQFQNISVNPDSWTR